MKQVNDDPGEVWLSPTTKKLLIRLEDNSRKFLEDLKTDKDAMMSVDTGDAVRGVILTTKVGEASVTRFGEISPLLSECQKSLAFLDFI